MNREQVKFDDDNNVPEGVIEFDPQHNVWNAFHRGVKIGFSSSRKESRQLVIDYYEQHVAPRNPDRTIKNRPSKQKLDIEKQLDQLPPEKKEGREPSSWEKRPGDVKEDSTDKEEHPATEESSSKEATPDERDVPVTQIRNTPPPPGVAKANPGVKNAPKK